LALSAFFLFSYQEDSDEDEFIAEEAKAKKAKQLSERKKMFKNRPVMPRTVTAGQRTVGDMTSTLERAGYDTSNLKAHVIAAKAIASKRKRAQNADDGMDVDTPEHDGWEDDAMDVDGETTAVSKRARNNSGGVATRSKLPQSNRQIAGLRNAEVGGRPCVLAVCLISVCTSISKQAKRSSCGI
jgi:nucleolar GTP-binding protein